MPEVLLQVLFPYWEYLDWLFPFLSFSKQKKTWDSKILYFFEKPTRYWKVIAPPELNSHKLAEKVCAFS
tara:strand:- start:259 stop:465 length:207 start_codon:yes stop_codon:yes gene_type:complete